MRRNTGAVQVRQLGSDLVEILISVVDVEKIMRRGRLSARDSALRAPVELTSLCTPYEPTLKSGAVFSLGANSPQSSSVGRPRRWGASSP